MTTQTLRSISYGGGVQSTSMVVLAALRHPAFEQAMGGRVDVAVFSNVGDDSEHPATVTYVRDVIMPWAAKRDFEVVETGRVKRNGETETLYGRLMKEGSRSVPIPVRMSNGAPGNRACTVDFKIKVIAKYLKQRGASEQNPATVAIGISTDEIQRVSNRSRAPYENVVYPLIDLMMSRQDCVNTIKAADLPVPPKSACFFCPFHRPQMWAEMRRDEPELFWKSVELERVLNERRDQLGKDHVYLTRFAKPLDEAIPEAQDQLPGFESIGETGCDEGYCWV